MLYCPTEENGTVTLAEASEKDCKEHSRFLLTPQSTHRAQKSTVSTPPVIARNQLYLRDHELLFCFHLKGR